MQELRRKNEAAGDRPLRQNGFGWAINLHPGQRVSDGPSIGIRVQRVSNSRKTDKDRQGSSLAVFFALRRCR